MYESEAIKIWKENASDIQTRLEREAAAWQEPGRAHLSHLTKAFAKGRDLRNHYVHAIYSTRDRGYALPVIAVLGSKLNQRLDFA